MKIRVNMTIEESVIKKMHKELAAELPKKPVSRWVEEQMVEYLKRKVKEESE